MKDEILLFKPYCEQEDGDKVAEVIRRGSHWADGPELEQFERSIAGYVGRKYALAFNSGSSALTSALRAVNVRGGEIIMPSFTFVATATSVIGAGGTPVFADIEPETMGLDINDVRRKITADTKAIVPVHFAGFPSKDILALRQLASERGLKLVEDAAHGLGTTLDGQYMGTFGDAAMFSFAQNKVLATAHGGMAVTDSEEIYRRLFAYRDHGKSPVAKEGYVGTGSNLRMTAITAALGLVQFSRLEKIIAMRRELADRMTQELEILEGLVIPKPLPGHTSTYQFYNLLLPGRAQRDGLMSHLKESGIPSRVTYPPLHLQRLYKAYGSEEGDLPVTEDVASRIVTIPFYPGMPEQHRERIMNAVRGYNRKM